MIWTIIKRVEALLAYREEDLFIYKSNVYLKLLALAVSWIALLQLSFPKIMIAVLYPVLLHLLSPWWLTRHTVTASSIPTGIIVMAASILSPYEPLSGDWLARVITLAVRTYGLSSVTLLTFSTTSPAKLTSALHRIPVLYDIVMITYRVLPLTVGDIAEALAAQRLLGKRLHHVFIPVTLLALRRSEGIAVSLYSRGYNTQIRAPIDDPGNIAYGILLLFVSIMTYVVAVLS
ncbi:MAG: energy-coupling factor transporter transmembrane protein EcfT [Desulfurococcales archaeon]|nr:energy-coupling factor transporter transmembrane protein EcfT [Desulfurococcales archaeon]